MSSILNSYIKKSILLNISVVFIILIFLSIIIRLIDELRNFERKIYSVFEILFYIILSLPKDFELFLPIATLLGGLLGLGLLEVRNELMTMQVFGLSKFQIILSVIKASVFVLIFNFVSNEWLLPYTQRMICIYRNYAQYNTYLFPEKDKNLWLVDKNNFISVEKMLTINELQGIHIYYLSSDKKLKKIIYIEHAWYLHDTWFSLNVVELDLKDHTFIKNKKILNYKWHTTLTPKILSILIINPRMLSILKLLCCIEYFDLVGQNSKYYQLIFWNKVLSPIVEIMMIITALLCSFGPFYCKKISIRLFFGSLIGFIFYMSYQIFGTLSIIYNISPLVSSVAPIILLLIINAIILWKYS